MTSKETILFKMPSKDGVNTNRMFSCTFKPDPTYEDWCVGMMFHVVSVNRMTGEVWFSLDLDYEQIPKR